MYLTGFLPCRFCGNDKLKLIADALTDILGKEHANVYCQKCCAQAPQKVWNSSHALSVLHLTLKKEWFDLILACIKKEEYREIKPYWIKRLMAKKFDAINFRNGYAAKAPEIFILLDDISQGTGNLDWGAPNYPVFKLKLGEIISTKNIMHTGDICRKLTTTN